MPTYEYACTACSHEWEFEQSMKDEPLKVCPSCKKKTAKRQISRGTGFILKGSGWYSDLYSGSSNKGGSETKSSASAETKTTAAASSDASSSTSSDSSSSSKSDASSTPSAPATGGTSPTST